MKRISRQLSTLHYGRAGLLMSRQPHTSMVRRVPQTPRHHTPTPGIVGLRRFATAASDAASQGSKKNDSNIFLDNLGTIFLSVIGVIIGTLVRSSFNTNNRNAVRDDLENISALDPVEIDDLRIANSELKPDVFAAIMKDLGDRYPHNSCSYNEFTQQVRQTMVHLKGEAFTIELGHLVDRVVTEVLVKVEKSADEPLPLDLWLTTLTLALNSSVSERIRILYKIMEMSESPVLFSNVLDMVGHLQNTSQLPPDTQIVPTDTKVPTQQWERGTPRDLVPWDGTDRDVMDLEAFNSILRSKSVCAWGECYHKKKISANDD